MKHPCPQSNGVGIWRVPTRTMDLSVSRVAVVTCCSGAAGDICAVDGKHHDSAITKHFTKTICTHRWSCKQEGRVRCLHPTRTLLA